MPPPHWKTVSFRVSRPSPATTSENQSNSCYRKPTQHDTSSPSSTTHHFCGTHCQTQRSKHLRRKLSRKKWKDTGHTSSLIHKVAFHTNSRKIYSLSTYKLINWHLDPTPPPLSLSLSLPLPHSCCTHHRHTCTIDHILARNPHSAHFVYPCDFSHCSNLSSLETHSIRAHPAGESFK